MPHRLNEERSKVQFITFAEMPAMIHDACIATDAPSNTVYIQRAVCEALARDLEIPLATLLERLPSPKGRARVLFGGDRKTVRRIGPSGAVEEVS